MNEEWSNYLLLCDQTTALNEVRKKGHCVR